MRSSQSEQALRKEGFQESDGTLLYMPRLEISAIDTQAGLRNQARLLEPIDPELQESYFIMSEEGSEAPAIVVYKRKNRPVWVPIDGNQRIAVAKKRNQRFVDAYQVNTESQEIIDRLTWFFNNKVNGKRLKREENIEHAVTMVNKYGWDVKVAASYAGVAPRAVTKRISMEKLRNILRNRGATTACQLTDDKIEELQPLVNLGEELFTEAAKITYSCGLGLNDIMELKKDINHAKTVEAKTKAVVDFGNSPKALQRRAETKGGTLRPKRYGSQPCEELFTLAKKMDRLLNKYDKHALRRSGVGFKEQRELVQEVVNGLITTFGLGARVNDRLEEVCP